MKKSTTIIYWVVTIIFVAYMLFTAFPNVITDENSVKFISGYLGYPKYMIPFLGVAKVLGCIVLLIPGLRSSKEWAYAGLFFDLVGATYSVSATGGLNFQTIIFMGLPIVFLFVSYYLWHKRLGETVRI
jgi:hypothetical protein